jgi:hypothetical protein
MSQAGRVSIHIPDLEERNLSVLPRVIGQVPIKLPWRSAGPDISDFVQRR